MRNKRIKPNFRVKHPYGYLIKSMLIGLVLVFTSIFSMATGVINLKPASNADAAVSGNWSDSVSSSYNASLSTKGFGSGNGTESSPFTINTIGQWRCFSDFVYNWNGGYKYYFQLGKDLDFNGHYYDSNMAIGRGTSGLSPSIATATKATSAGTTGKSFAGVFYGNGYRIKNVTIKEGYMVGGLFTSIAGTSAVYTGTSATYCPNYSESYYSPAVYDLVIENMNEEEDACGEGFGAVTGSAIRAVISNVLVCSDQNGSFECGAGAYIGGIAGVIGGTHIYGCKVEGITLLAAGNVGGIVGSTMVDYGNNFIINCHNSATVKCTSTYGGCAGGISGGSMGPYGSGAGLLVGYSWNTGTVTYDGTLGSSSTNGSTTTAYTNFITNGGIAGLVGQGDNTNSYLYIDNCYNAGEVYVNSYEDGSITKVKARYGLAKTFSAGSGYNYYDSSKTTTGSNSTSKIIAYSSSIFQSSVPTQTNSNDIYCNSSNLGYFVAGISGSENYRYPVNTRFPVSQNSTGLAGYIINRAATVVSSRHVGSSLAKQVYIGGMSTTAKISFSNMTNLTGSNTGRTGYCLTRVPSNNSSSSLTITSAVGKGIKLSITKKNSRTSTISTIVRTPSSSTASASYTITYNNYDLHEYYITVNEFNALSGTGTATNPYLITSRDDFLSIQYLDGVNTYFALANDIEISMDIGQASCLADFLLTRDFEFRGILDGRGYFIRNRNNGFQLFANIANSGKIYNLNIYDYGMRFDSAESQEIQANYYPCQGFIIAETNKGAIDNVRIYIGGAHILDFSRSFAYTDAYAGVFVARNEGTISNCYLGGPGGGGSGTNEEVFTSSPENWHGLAHISVSVDDQSPEYMDINVGGICGYNSGSLIGNTVNAEFVGDTSLTNSVNNYGSVTVGGVYALDYRANNTSKVVTDNFFEGSFFEFPTASVIGGLCGDTRTTSMSSANFPQTTTRNITRLISASSTFADSMFGALSITTASESNLTYQTQYSHNVASSTIDTCLPIISSGATFYDMENLLGTFDPQYWIFLKQGQVSGVMGGYNGDVFYPRSKKPLMATSSDDSNNWQGGVAPTIDTTSVNVGCATELGEVAASIRDGKASNLTTINITDDIYLYGHYWTPIRSITVVNGNGHTIYGLDSVGSGGDTFGGLLDYAESLQVNNLNFVDCTISSNMLLNFRDLGFVANYSYGSTYENITFENCHILLEGITQAVHAGFVVGSIGDGGTDTFDNISIKAKKTVDTWKSSTIFMDRMGDPYSINIGGIVGYVTDSSTVNINDLEINGFQINVGETDIGSAMDFAVGGVVGESDAAVIINKANIVSLSLNGNLLFYDGELYMGGVIGLNYGGYVEMHDSIVWDYINIPIIDGQPRNFGIGGIAGYNYGQGVVWVKGCDIYTTIRGTTSGGGMVAALHGFYGYLGGVVGASNNSVLVFENNVMRFSTNLISDNKDGIFVIRGDNPSTTQDADRSDVSYNIFSIITSSNKYDYVYPYSPSSAAYANYYTDNLVYYEGGTSGDYGIRGWDVYYNDTTALGNLDKSNDLGFSNDFYRNKFIRSGYIQDGTDPIIRKYGDTSDTNNFVAPWFNDNGSTHTVSNMQIKGFGITVYNVLDPEKVTKINVSNSLGASSTVITVNRGAYEMDMSTSATSYGGHYVAYNDKITITMHGTEYKYSAVWNGITSSSSSPTTLKSIVSYVQSPTNLYLTDSTIVNSDYWKGYSQGTSKHLNIHVSLSLNKRYFAVHNSMTVTGYNPVSTRGDFNVYAIDNGTTVTLRTSGNTIGYSTNTSDTRFITGIGKGEIDVENQYDDLDEVATSAKSIAINGYYEAKITINNSTASSSSTGKIIAYNYYQDNMYKHTIKASGDTDGAGNAMTSPSSTNMYFRISSTKTGIINDSTNYTTLMVRDSAYLKDILGEYKITYTYPSTNGEWTASNVTIGSTDMPLVANDSNKSYIATSSARTTTINYKCNTYYTTLYTWQEAASYGIGVNAHPSNWVPTTVNGATASGVPSALWGGWNSSLQVSTYANGYGSLATVAVSSLTGYNAIRKSMYLTYAGKNYIGDIYNDTKYDTTVIAYVSLIVNVKYNTTVSMNATLPSGYKLSQAIYTIGSTVQSGTTISGNTVIFTVKGSGVLDVRASQDKWDDSGNYSTPSGSGTADAPYQIATAANFGWMVNQINSNSSYASKYYTLSADIDLAGKYVSPIRTTFTGTFTGGSSTVKHTIKNLKMWTLDSAYLFAYNSGTIRNILLLNPTISSTEAEVGLVSVNNGTIENFGVHTSDTSTAFVSSGRSGNGFALIGENYGTVSSVFNTAKIYSTGLVAGVVGANYYTAKNIYSNFSFTSIAGMNITVAALVSTNSNGSGSGKVATITNAYTAVNLGSSYSNGYLYQSNASGSTIKNVYYLSGAFGGTPTNNGTVSNVVAKTSAQLQDSNQYSSWDNFGENWSIKASASGLYNGQPQTGYPLLTMGDDSGMMKVSFRYAKPGSEGLWNTSSAVAGWTMPSDIWVTPGKAFSFSIAKASGTFPTPLYIQSVKSYSGFTESIAINATNRSATNSFTITASQCAFSAGTTQAYLVVHFYTATATFNSDVDNMISGVTLVTGTDSLSAKASSSTSDTTVAATFNYGINTNYNPLIFQSFAIGGVNLLTGHSTTAVTRYIYLNNGTYTANSSKSGTGTYCGTVNIVPNTTKAGKITFSELKENLTVTAIMYQGVQISYGGLVSGTTNTITSYYSTSAITTTTTSTKIADVRASGGAASGTTSTYYIPVKSSGSRVLVGTVLKGNTTSYTYYEFKHNNTTDFTNENYASVADKAHSLTSTQMNQLLATTSAYGTLKYTYGPGSYTVNITLGGLKIADTPSAIKITMANGGSGNGSKTFASIAKDQSVSFTVTQNYTPKFTASFTAASGKNYRFIWSELSTITNFVAFLEGSGVAGNSYTTDSITANKTIYLLPVQLLSATLTYSKDMLEFASSYESQHPGFEIVSTANIVGSLQKTGYLAGKQTPSISIDNTDGSVNSVTLKDFDYNCNLTYRLKNRIINSSVGLNYFDVFSSADGTASKVVVDNTVLTLESHVRTANIKTTITNKDLSMHKNLYIGITRIDGTGFDKNTLHSKDANGKYYVKYLGFDTSQTNTPSSTERDYRLFEVVLGEHYQIRRWDTNDGGVTYLNNISSITHDSNEQLKYTDAYSNNKLVGVDLYILRSDTFKFTYYPYVQIGLSREISATSDYAKNNPNTLLPVVENTNVIIQGATSADGTYNNAEANNIFEAPIFIKITYKVPQSNLTGWTFNGWYQSASAISNNSTVNGIKYTTSTSTYNSGGTTYTQYVLQFECKASDVGDNETIANFQYIIKFTENTHTLSVYTYLMSGGSTALTDNVSKKTLIEYNGANYTGTARNIYTNDTSKSKSTTIGYYGYYKVTQTTCDANNYEFASGSELRQINKEGDVSTSATYKKWHTINDPTITITYSTSGYTTGSTVNTSYNRTVSGYVYTFSARKTSDSTSLATIGTITLSGITVKNNIKKVLEGATLTVTYTTNTNKFRCTTAPASKTITADTTITGAFAENVINFYFYKNTASSTKLNSTAVALGTLNEAYSIPSTYQASPSNEYVFETWTTNGSLTFANANTLATSITARSINGVNGATVSIYANWRRVYYHTWGAGDVTTSHTTTGKSCAGGTVSVTPASTNKGSNEKYAYTNTATVSSSTYTGHKFVSFVPSNATISGSTATRTGTNYTISSNKITVGSTTYYVSGSYLYQDSACKIRYSAYDYKISGSTCTIYDKANATVGATFDELTYTITVKDTMLENGYARLDYVNLTGTQYINTGVIPTINTRTETVIETSTFGKWLFGSRKTGGDSTTYAFYLNSSTSLWLQLASSNPSAQTISTGISGKKTTIGTDKNYIYVNGAKVNSTAFNISSMGTSTYSMYLGGLNQGGSLESRVFIGKIYSSKIYNGDTLVRNFVPVKNSSGTVGLYDTVNSKFYASAGTGAFTGGTVSGNIRITPSTTQGSFVNTEISTNVVVGYFSSIKLEYISNDPTVRFSGWDIKDSSAFGNTPEPSNNTITLGPNILANATVTLLTVSQRKIANSAFIIRYLTSGTASYPTISKPNDIQLLSDNKTIVFIYDNFALSFVSSGQPIQTTNWSRTCSTSGHVTSGLASRTTACSNCKFNGVDMYAVTNGDTITASMYLTSTSDITIPKSGSASWYKFTTPSNENTWSVSSTATNIPSTGDTTGFKISGNKDSRVTITFPTTTTALPKAPTTANTLSWGIRLYQSVSGDDHTSTGNSHVYVVNPNTPSVKVLEGTNTKLYATDYEDSSVKKTYKFSHWTFTPSDSAYSSNSGWITETDTNYKYNKSFEFAVYANRAGTYTAHYKYAYSLTADDRATNDGKNFTTADVATLNRSAYTHANDQKYLAGSTVTITPTLKSGYVYYGWYLLNGTTYTALTSSTTGVSELSSAKLSFTVGGLDCDGNTINGIDLENNTIIYAGRKLIEVKFGTEITGISATYKLESAGLVSATDGSGNALTKSDNAVSCTLSAGQYMTAYILDGSTFTLTETHTAGTHRALGILYGTGTEKLGTLQNNGLTGVVLSGRSTSTQAGTYKVVFTPVFVLNPTLEVNATHVTNGKTASFTGSDYIKVSATGGRTYNNVIYYDYGTVVTITGTIPTGYNFSSWTITDSSYKPTTNPATITTVAGKPLTKIVLNIVEKEYDIAKVVNVSIPAKSLGDGGSTPSSATTWTSNGFGTLSYTSNHNTASTTKVGHFGTISGLGFTSANKLYVANSKLYYDSEHTHAVDTNLYKGLNTSSVTFMGKDYSISNSAITISTSLYTMYASASYSTSNGTLSGTSITGITGKVTITVTAKMNVLMKQDFASNKDGDTLTGGTSTSKTTTLGGSVSFTANDITGYVFKGWQEYRYMGGTLTLVTASGSYYSTAKTISVTAFEQRDGAVFRAVYAPLYSLTVDASTFSQGSVKVTIGSGATETITASKTYSGIEYGTTISLTATASGQNRINYWSVNTGAESLTDYDDDIEFNIMGTATATHNFLTQYNITINHSDSAGGTWTIQEYVNNGTVAAPKWEWQNVTDTNFVNASGSEIYILADRGTQYRVVITTNTHYKVAVTASGMTYNVNNEDVTLGTTTVTFDEMTQAGTVNITHTALSYITLSTSPAGLNNTVKIDSTSGTGNIKKLTVVAGNHTLTTTAVSGYGTPSWWNEDTRITSDDSTDELTLTLLTTVGTTYNIAVKFSSTSIASTVQGYTDSFKYASITGSTTDSYSTVSHDYSPEITLKNNATGISFKGFDSTKHVSMSLYAGLLYADSLYADYILVKTVTSDTAIEYTLPVGLTVPELKLVFENKTWIDSGVYTAPTGSGTASDPYIIATSANLAWISYQSANGEKFANKYFKQTASIDMSSRLWVPIQNFNGIYNGANYSITGIECVGEKYNIKTYTGLTAETINGLQYSVGSLIYASNGGVFKNIKFGATTTTSTSTTNNVSTLAGSLIATATNVVVDKVVLAGTKLSVPYFVSGGLLIGKLSGGKITNINFVSGATINDSCTVDDKTNSDTSNMGGLIGETLSGTATYYDCNGGTANVVVENINLPSATKANTSCTAGGLIGKNTTTLKVNNVYRANSLAVIGSDTGSTTSTNVVANGSASTVKDIYNQGANPWYYISDSKYGLNIDASNTITIIDTSLTASDTITLGEGTTLGKFEQALKLLATDSTVTKVLLDADLDFGGASMTARYNLPTGKTFDGQGHTVKGISAVAAVSVTSAIWNTVSGTIKRVQFENLYVKIEVYSSYSVGYSHIGLIAGYVHAGSMTNITVKNSRIDYNFDGVYASSESGTNVGTIVGAFDSNPVIKDIELYNCKLNYSQYGTSTTNSMDISGFSPYLGGGMAQNIGVDTDMVVQGSYASNYVSGIGGKRSAITLTNGYFRGNVYSNMSANYIAPIAYAASTVKNAFASGTFSTKSNVAKIAGNSGTFTNVYISSNASSVSGTVSDTNLKSQSTYSGFNFAKGSNADTLQWTMDSAYGYADGYAHFSIPANNHRISVVISGTGASAITLHLGNSDTTNDVHGDVTLSSSGGSRLFYHDLYSPKLYGLIPNGYYVKAGLAYTYIEDEKGNKSSLLDSDLVGGTDVELNIDSDISGKLKSNGSIIDGTVYITIEKSNYTVTATADGHGTVSGAGTFAFGSSVTLKATPSANTDNYHAHRFVGWYKAGKIVSTNASYTFTMSDATQGAYTAKFCGSTNNECNYKATASTTNASTNVSPTDTGWALGGTSKTFTITLGAGQEITSITRTNPDSASAVTVYTKTGGAISGYTYTSNKLTFTLNNTTRGAYSFVVGATSSNVTINIPNVGMSERSTYGAYSAHGDITLTTGSTTSTIGASATTGTVAVIYNNTLKITFMSNVRYKLGSVVTTQSGAGTTFTTTTSTVDGYTRYTYTYTTSAVTANCTITLNLVKDRWVDITNFSGTSGFGAGHSAEFTTANGGNASLETTSTSSNPTYGTDQRYKGTMSNPIVISTPAQLARVAYLINTNKSFYYYSNASTAISQMYYGSAYYVISANIDLGNYFWTPINLNEIGRATYILADTQRTISNMNIRFDKEEYVLNGNSPVTKHIGFASSLRGSITGITFENATLYNTQASSSSVSIGIATGQLINGSLNFVTVKNSTVEAASYIGGLTGVTYYDSAINNCNSINNTLIYNKDNTISSANGGGITAYCYDSAMNGVSVSGLKIENNGSYTLTVGALANSISNASISNVVVKSASKTGTTKTNLYTITRLISKNCNFENVWTYSTSGAYSGNYGSHTISTLPSSPTVSGLGLSADLWYVSSNIPYLKSLGTSNGTTTVAKIADVTTGTFTGSGSKEDPYLIDTAAKFRYFTYLINSNNSTYNTSSKYFKLTADIDLGGGFSSILGKAVDANYVESSNRFKAHLDGDFHTISNVTIFEMRSKFVGFIGYTDTNATIKNLNLDKMTIIGIGTTYVGGLIGCGYLGVNVDNVNLTNAYISNAINNSGYLGGLVGMIRTSSSTTISTNITNSGFDGVIVARNSYVGGIVGSAQYANNTEVMTISNCYASGHIIAAYGTSVGGILGGVSTMSSYPNESVKISNCYNDATIHFVNGQIGGIVGYSTNVQIENCYNNGTMSGQLWLTVGTTNAKYISDANWNNGSVSINNSLAVFVGEIVGRNYDNTANTTKISNSYFADTAQIVIENWSTNNILLPYGNSSISGHTEKGYSVWTYVSGGSTISSKAPTGSAGRKDDSDMKSPSTFAGWDTKTSWYSASGSVPVHRWNTQNRLYFEGTNLSIGTDSSGNKVVKTDNGMIKFASGVVPLSDTDGRIFVYVAGNSLSVTFAPDTNYILSSASTREYYGTSYSSILSGSTLTYNISFSTYSDGTNFKVLNASFINNKFTITVNTSLTRGTGISIGEYETLHIVIVNHTTNEAYSATLDDGTYVFDNLKQGTYYVAIYTTMFFNVSSANCIESKVNFTASDFYYTLVLGNSTSPNATISIVATKTVDAWIYSKLEVGA